MAVSWSMKAKDKSGGMTLDELEQFVQAARAGGATGGVQIGAATSIRGRLQSLTVAS